MKPIVKLNDKTNERIAENLATFPYYTIKSKLPELLKNRGMKMQELADLSGVRIATISEISNMKRSTLNVSHLLAIALTLRITDISELFEIIMPEDTYKRFKKDQKIIDQQGLLPDQHDYLKQLKEQRKNPPSN